MTGTISSVEGSYVQFQHEIPKGVTRFTAPDGEHDIHAILNYRAVLIGEFSDKLEAGQEVTFA